MALLENEVVQDESSKQFKTWDMDDDKKVLFQSSKKNQPLI